MSVNESFPGKPICGLTNHIMRVPRVFERTEEDSAGARISAGRYNLLIGLVLCWGFLVNWLIVRFVPYEAVADVHWLVFLIGYFVSCFLGVRIFTKSQTPAISFIGYNLVVLPFGFVINRMVHHYDESLVLEAIRVTALVTVVMMALGSLIPAFFKKTVGVLSIILVSVIVIELIEMFVFGVNHGWLDWLVVAIFCGLIGFNWARANSIPKTADNAVDSAAALYTNIINLFLRMLRIIGRKRKHKLIV